MWTFKKRKKETDFDKDAFRKKVMSEEIDFMDAATSCVKAKEIYDELKVILHPDRFVGQPDKQELATELFQLLTKNKNSYKFLQELKIRVHNELLN